MTRQLNSFKPTSADVVGDLKENLSKEVAQKLSDSEQKVNQLSDSLEEQKKSVNNNAGFLRDLMIGIENMEENMKNIQEKMDYWRNPEVMEAEEELECFHDEVPLHIPDSKGPENVTVALPEDPFPFLAQRQNPLPYWWFGRNSSCQYGPK